MNHFHLLLFIRRHLKSAFTPDSVSLYRNAKQTTYGVAQHQVWCERGLTPRESKVTVAIGEYKSGYLIGRFTFTCMELSYVHTRLKLVLRDAARCLICVAFCVLLYIYRLLTYRPRPRLLLMR